MREQLNNNPLAQLAVIGALLLGGGFFAITTMGGGSGEEAGEGATSSTSLSIEVPSSAQLESGATASGAPTVPAGAAPPVPKPVRAAWKAGDTVAILFVRDGGIDDALVKGTSESLASFPDVVRFVVPASEIFKYGAISEGVGVDRVPALVVITPRRVDEPVPTASVSYGFRTRASVNQAVIDAGYEGRTLSYHP